MEKNGEDPTLWRKINDKVLDDENPPDETENCTDSSKINISKFDLSETKLSTKKIEYIERLETTYFTEDVINYIYYIISNYKNETKDTNLTTTYFNDDQKEIILMNKYSKEIYFTTINNINNYKNQSENDIVMNTILSNFIIEWIKYYNIYKVNEIEEISALKKKYDDKIQTNDGDNIKNNFKRMCFVLYCTQILFNKGILQNDNNIQSIIKNIGIFFAEIKSNYYDCFCKQEYLFKPKCIELRF